jgi:hypothetical protein
MTYTTEAPKVNKSTRFNDDREEVTHPAYGVISVSRPTGGKTMLFDSAIKHGSVVAIQISEAQNDRALNRNWIHEKKRICEFYMSEAQWAQFVSSAGMGGGTPITFRAKPDADAKLLHVPGIAPHENMKQTFSREMRESCEQYVKELSKLQAEVKAYATAGKANKTQLNDIVSRLDTFTRNFPSNMAFTQKQFAEAMEATTEQAKSDIEAFVVNMAMNTGLDVLRTQNIQLVDTSEATDLPVIEHDTDA